MISRGPLERREARATRLGAKLAIMHGSTLQRADVPLTGGTEAVYNSSGIAYYRHSDWLGSSRLASTTSRTVYYDGAYGPFGEPYAGSGTTDLSFTGMKQDTAANVYDFPAREYGIQGRWPSPDPAGLAAVDPSDPQTWNRYAYVRNNPLAFVDPTGLRCRDPKATSCNATLSNYLCDSPWADDYSCDFTPGIGVFSEFDLLEGLCLGECAYLDQIM